MGRSAAGLPSAAVTACLLVACGLGQAGMELPRQADGLTFPGERRDVTGVLSVAANGCLDLVMDGTVYFVIWPKGSLEADRVKLPGGSVVAEGDMVAGTGAFTPTSPWVANRDDYWSRAVGYCAGDATEMLVLDTAQKAPPADQP